MFTNITIKIVIKTFFFIFNKINIWFAKKKPIWKSYIIVKAFFITFHIEIINKNKFKVAILKLENEIFVIYIVFFLG